MRNAILFSLVAGSCAAAAPGSKDKDPPPKPSPLVGEWEIVSATTQGNTRPWEFGGIHVFTADGKYRTKFDGPDDEITWQKYSVDDKADPKTLDIVITDKTGKVTTWRWLYRIDGDKLDYSWRADDHTVRPKEFEAGKGSKNVIHTLKRMTPKK
jgi:uncharacterized protein (TIGR03067 family)